MSTVIALPDPSAVLAAVDFKAGWDKIWTAVQSGMGTGFTIFLTAVGVAIVVVAILAWVWGKARNRPTNAAGLVWSIAFGALLAAPALIIPFVLFVASGAVNAYLNITNQA